MTLAEYQRAAARTLNQSLSNDQRLLDASAGLAEEAVRAGGHGGMDFVMLWRIVYCLRNGLPMDQDVYDAAAWSVVTPLTVESNANRGRSVDFPDFTRGKWKRMKPLAIVS